ncbi:TPA: hypothetical protein DD617_01475 [Candidatus Uhrbacteria bacterium]|nr:hypothetical protein [Candidatus Uhrbacteria bacterium]
MFKKQFFKKSILLMAGVLVFFVIVFLYCQAIILESAHGRIFEKTKIPSAFVVIVPGASVFPNGRPSDVLADRLLTALDLYRAGTVQKFLLSGDHGHNDYDEVNVMRDFLLEHGVSPEDLFLDHAGFDTYDTMYRAHAIFGVEQAIVTTQAYHLPRAIYVAKSVGINISGVAADRQIYVKMSFFRVREWFARGKAVLDVWFKVHPKFLGETISIKGDGRVTWDQKEKHQ